MIGAGVLTLPYAMSELGWGPGVAVMTLSWIMTLYTLWQMVEMHEMVPGKRFDRYHELGQYAFGETLGLWIVVPQQLVVEVSLDIVYMITGGKSLKKFHDLVCEDRCKDIKLSYFIMIFASAQFVISQLPNFDSIATISLAAALMSICDGLTATRHRSRRLAGGGRGGLRPEARSAGRRRGVGSPDEMNSAPCCGGAPMCVDRGGRWFPGAGAQGEGGRPAGRKPRTQASPPSFMARCPPEKTATAYAIKEITNRPFSL